MSIGMTMKEIKWILVHVITRGLILVIAGAVFYVVSPRYTLVSSQGIAHKMSIRTGKAWHIFLDTEKPVRRVKAD